MTAGLGSAQGRRPRGQDRGSDGREPTLPASPRLLEGSQAVRPPAPWAGLRLPSHEGCCGSYALLFVPELPPGVAGCAGGRLSPTLPRARATRTETP